MTLYKYLAREILLATLTVTLVVLCIAVGWRFSGYLRQAAGGVLTSDILLSVVWLRLPSLLELIVPLGFFLGIMLAFGRLYADSEMVVLEACGFSPAHLLVVIAALSVLVAGLTGSLSLYFTPTGEARLEALFQTQRSLTEFDTLAPGRFQMLSSGRRVTYTRRMDEQGNLEGVFMDELQDSSGQAPDALGPRSTHTVIAESGRQQVDHATGDRFLVLEHGTRYSGTPGRGDYQVIEFQEYGQLISRESNSFRRPKRTAIPTRELWGDPAPRSRSELQWRISLVLIVPVLALLAIPLSRINPRQGRYSRLVPGLGLSFMYVLLLSACRSAVEREELSAELGLWWVHPAFLVVSLLLFGVHNLPWPGWSRR